MKKDRLFRIEDKIGNSFFFSFISGEQKISLASICPLSESLVVFGIAKNKLLTSSLLLLGICWIKAPGRRGNA